MNVVDALRAVKQWGPFAARTIGYGSVSLALGPLTRDHRASLWAMRNWCKSSLKGLRIEVESSGEELVPPGASVYCSNHQSIVDILVLGATLPGDFKWAAKRSLMKIPFLGWHLALSGHVPVDRRSGSRAAAEVIARFEEVLRAGKPLLVFPEGTRTPDGTVKEFKNGGFYAAVRAGAPVVPVALEGTHTIMEKGALHAMTEATRVRIRIGAPIHAKKEGREAHRVADLRERTHAAVVELHRSIGGATAPVEAAQAGAPAPGDRADRAL